jgi:hypothetical protein
MEVGHAFIIDNSNNDLKTLDPKLALKDLDEVKQTVESHKGGPYNDVTEQTTMCMKHHRWS